MCTAVLVLDVADDLGSILNSGIAHHLRVELTSQCNEVIFAKAVHPTLYRGGCGKSQILTSLVARVASVMLPP